MESKSILKSLYYSMKRRRKTQEQLQIGKIKFEVTPIYVNKVCVHSLFQLKYTPQVETETKVNKYSVLIKTALLISMIFFLYATLYSTLLNLGIIVESNSNFIAAVTPYIFSELPSYYTPHLAVLLKEINIISF